MTSSAGTRVVVLGADAEAVAGRVGERRAGDPSARVVGFVGDDEALARCMGDELLGGVDDLDVTNA